MGKSIVLITFIIVLMAVGHCLKPSRITKRVYDNMKNEINNTHYFVLTIPTPLQKLIQQRLQQFSSHNDHNHKIQVYLCNPIQNKEMCTFDQSLYLFINTVKIQYNGNPDNINDYIRWMRYRIDQLTTRVYSVQELREFISSKNQVFCYVDRYGEQPTFKQYIFTALAKKLHFLHFCNVDASIGVELGLRQGHIAMIRKDLSKRFDYWTQNMQQDNVRLYQSWINFIIFSCQTAFRQQNKNRSHDWIAFQCDFSLQCEDQLLIILDSQLIWRQKHPQINIKLKFIPGTAGQIKINKRLTHDLPLIRYGITRVEKQIVFHDNTGMVTEETKYISTIYMQVNPVLDEGTIERVLKDYEEGKLEFTVIDSETDVRSMGDQAEALWEARRKQLQEKRKRQEQYGQEEL